MRSLDRKLLRDLWHVKTQAVAIALRWGFGWMVVGLILSIGGVHVIKSLSPGDLPRVEPRPGARPARTAPA